MTLKTELGLKRPIAHMSHEAVQNIYYTATSLKKKATEFFQPFGLTDVQFNVLMLLLHQSGDEGGLSQASISDMMLVNRANITSLIDRMEKADLVKRTAADDRRYNIIKMTGKARKLLAKVRPLYAKEVQKVMSCLKEAEQKNLILSMEKIRGSINE
jgi:DNA-binding MarR family transcriptional regulator